MDELVELRRNLEEKSLEVDRLRQKLKLYEEHDKRHKAMLDCELINDNNLHTIPHLSVISKLENSSIARHSRQLILPEIGVKGQISIANTSVLIVGAGGLGCPSAIYLAAAGIGRLGIVDYDEVELSNLHRQVLHTEDRIGIEKSASVTTAIKGLNSSVVCIPYHMSLNSSNAIQVIQQYDIVLDCTDNVATRYLLNDACVLTGKPLVSGSALRFEGQVTVYNTQDGPCYRCLFPIPPPPETVTNCSDGGVLGVVPGIIGCIQALETLKIASGIGASYCQKLLVFDGIDGTFRTIKLRSKKKNCVVCSENPTITQLIDYEQFCGSKATDKSKTVKLLSNENRISVENYANIVKEKHYHVLVDVRTPCEMDICQLPNTINIPITEVGKNNDNMHKLKTAIDKLTDQVQTVPVYVVCRLGNDSQSAVQILQEMLSDLPVTIKDIRGGLVQWAKKIDPEFPQY
uniref:Adenylyltransferase and sulfurtransferase MOCS3 homolog n=1 Tax=Saccoglossus kowalevskii TaxID=10224 RepID=A0ABM0MJP3_SACKO|nr:PREDICTED: adenylyltransferase and sulfurtransferase MOCS3-like [Saccoglossus kowalevskii]